MSSINERIVEIMQHYGLNKNSFSIRIGMTNNTAIGKIVNEPSRKPSYEIIMKIMNTFPEINRRWFIEGKGVMLVHGVGTRAWPDPDKCIQYYDLQSPSELAKIIKKEFNGEISCAIHGFPDCEISLPIFGDDMIPVINPGEVILCKKMSDILIPGYSYLFFTENMAFCRILMDMDDNSYKLHACNPNYVDFRQKREEITAIYLIKGIIKRHNI
jgi:hypothetical protein